MRPLFYFHFHSKSFSTPPLSLSSPPPLRARFSAISRTRISPIQTRTSKAATAATTTTTAVVTDVGAQGGCGGAAPVYAALGKTTDQTGATCEESSVVTISDKDECEAAAKANSKAFEHFTDPQWQPSRPHGCHTTNAQLDTWYFNPMVGTNDTDAADRLVCKSCGSSATTTATTAAATQDPLVCLKFSGSNDTMQHVSTIWGQLGDRVHPGKRCGPQHDGEPCWEECNSVEYDWSGDDTDVVPTCFFVQYKVNTKAVYQGGCLRPTRGLEYLPRITAADAPPSLGSCALMAEGIDNTFSCSTCTAPKCMPTNIWSPSAAPWACSPKSMTHAQRHLHDPEVVAQIVESQSMFDVRGNRAKCNVGNRWGLNVGGGTFDDGVFTVASGLCATASHLDTSDSMCSVVETLVKTLFTGNCDDPAPYNPYEHPSGTWQDIMAHAAKTCCQFVNDKREYADGMCGRAGWGAHQDITRCATHNRTAYPEGAPELREKGDDFNTCCGEVGMQTASSAPSSCSAKDAPAVAAPIGARAGPSVNTLANGVAECYGYPDVPFAKVAAVSDANAACGLQDDHLRRLCCCLPSTYAGAGDNASGETMPPLDLDEALEFYCPSTVKTPANPECRIPSQSDPRRQLCARSNDYCDALPAPQSPGTCKACSPTATRDEPQCDSDKRGCSSNLDCLAKIPAFDMAMPWKNITVANPADVLKRPNGVAVEDTYCAITPDPHDYDFDASSPHDGLVYSRGECVQCVARQHSVGGFVDPNAPPPPPPRQYILSKGFCSRGLSGPLTDDSIRNCKTACGSCHGTIDANGSFRWTNRAPYRQHQLACEGVVNIPQADKTLMDVQHLFEAYAGGGVDLPGRSCAPLLKHFTPNPRLGVEEGRIPVTFNSGSTLERVEGDCYIIKGADNTSRPEAYALVRCDAMSTEAKYRDGVRVNSGGCIPFQTATDENSCTKNGFIWGPFRTKSHKEMVRAQYEDLWLQYPYLDYMPGVYNPVGSCYGSECHGAVGFGANYTSCAMKGHSIVVGGDGEDASSGEVSRCARDWRAVGGGSWWLSDVADGEPNGDYAAYLPLKEHPTSKHSKTRFNDADRLHFNDEYIGGENFNDGDHNTLYFCTTPPEAAQPDDSVPPLTYQSATNDYCNPLDSASGGTREECCMFELARTTSWKTCEDQAYAEVKCSRTSHEPTITLVKTARHGSLSEDYRGSSLDVRCFCDVEHCTSEPYSTVSPNGKNMLVKVEGSANREVTPYEWSFYHRPVPNQDRVNTCISDNTSSDCSRMEVYSVCDNPLNLDHSSTGEISIVSGNAVTTLDCVGFAEQVADHFRGDCNADFAGEAWKTHFAKAEAAACCVNKRMYWTKKTFDSATNSAETNHNHWPPYLADTTCALSDRVTALGSALISYERWSKKPASTDAKPALVRPVLPGDLISPGWCNVGDLCWFVQTMAPREVAQSPLQLEHARTYYNGISVGSLNNGNPIDTEVNVQMGTIGTIESDQSGGLRSIIGKVKRQSLPSLLHYAWAAPRSSKAAECKEVRLDAAPRQFNQLMMKAASDSGTQLAAALIASAPTSGLPNGAAFDSDAGCTCVPYGDAVSCTCNDCEIGRPYVRAGHGNAGASPNAVHYRVQMAVSHGDASRKRAAAQGNAADKCSGDIRVPMELGPANFMHSPWTGAFGFTPLSNEQTYLFTMQHILAMQGGIAVGGECEHSTECFGEKAWCHPAKHTCMSGLVPCLQTDGTPYAFEVCSKGQREISNALTSNVLEDVDGGCVGPRSFEKRGSAVPISVLSRCSCLLPLSPLVC